MPLIESLNDLFNEETRPRKNYIFEYKDKNKKNTIQIFKKRMSRRINNVVENIFYSRV